MADRIQVDTELVSGDLAWLRRALPRSEGQHFPLGNVNVVDGHVEMELLRSLTRWRRVSGDGTGREDPFGLLPGNVGDEVEVVVVVQDDEPCGFSCRGDEEIGDLHSSLVAAFGEAVLDGHGPIQHLLVH